MIGIGIIGISNNVYLSKKPISWVKKEEIVLNHAAYGTYEGTSSFGKTTKTKSILKSIKKNKRTLFLMYTGDYGITWIAVRSNWYNIWYKCARVAFDSIKPKPNDETIASIMVEGDPVYIIFFTEQWDRQSLIQLKQNTISR